MKLSSLVHTCKDGFVLEVCLDGEQSELFSKAPWSGQFYMLRAKESNKSLGRPLSIYDWYHCSRSLCLRFLVVEKGEGTRALRNLCNYKEDAIELIGPLGNGYPKLGSGKKVCAVGGGIGIASVARLRWKLPEVDLYGCFKTFPDYCYIDVDSNYRTWGTIDYVHEHHAFVLDYIATEDGSAGKRGMLDAILTADDLKEKGYDVVYACRPNPMLAYVQRICVEAGVKCYLSMEEYMACGTGACLSCTLRTKDGQKLCCTDGPVFDGGILDFSELSEPKQAAIKVKSTSDGATTVDDAVPDLGVKIAGVEFKNPVIAASGTFGYGTEYKDIDVRSLGGICSKGITLSPRDGNRGRRTYETPSGLLNSIGLENPGVEAFIAEKLPKMLKLGTTVIVNLSGSSMDEYVEGARLLDATAADMIELNISCPNVKAGGMAFGMDPELAQNLVSKVRLATDKPLMVKLTPNAPDFVGVAMAARVAGADALSLVNTYQAMAIDVDTGWPVFENIRAGLSGPAIKPIALRMVYDLVQQMNKLPESRRIPIVGLGGIATWRDAVEFILAGAAAVQVGTATFAHPSAMSEIIQGLEAYMLERGFRTLDDFRGLAQ